MHSRPIPTAQWQSIMGQYILLTSQVFLLRSLSHRIPPSPPPPSWHFPSPVSLAPKMTVSHYIRTAALTITSQVCLTNFKHDIFLSLALIAKHYPVLTFSAASHRSPILIDPELSPPIPRSRRKCVGEFELRRDIT